MAFEVIRSKSYGLDATYQGPETKVVFTFDTWEVPGATGLIQLGLESTSLIPFGVFDKYLRMTIEEDDSPFFERHYRINLWLAGEPDGERNFTVPVGGIGQVGGDAHHRLTGGGAVGAPVDAAIGFVFTASIILAIGASIALVAAAVISSVFIGVSIKKAAGQFGNTFLIAGAVVALGLGSLAIVLAFKK